MRSDLDMLGYVLNKVGLAADLKASTPELPDKLIEKTVDDRVYAEMCAERDAREKAQRDAYLAWRKAFKMNYAKLESDLKAAVEAALKASEPVVQTEATARIGDWVRSYDFEGRTDCYIDGRVAAIVPKGGCERYEVRASVRCVYGRRKPDVGVYYPPVNFSEEKTSGVAVLRWDDGGTCNMDSLAIELPRAVEAKVEAALKASGLHGYKASGMWKGKYIISPPSGFQGNMRTREMEAMEKVMEARGWKTSGYYQMD